MCVKMVLLQKKGQFAVALDDALEDRGRGMPWLAKQVGSTYEHIRKLSHSLAFPSQRLLKEICRALELNEEATWNLVVADKIEQKYGRTVIAQKGTHKTGRYRVIERLLPRLTDEQFQDMVGMAKVWAQRNRRRQTLTGHPSRPR